MMAAQMHGKCAGCAHPAHARKCNAGVRVSRSVWGKCACEVSTEGAYFSGDARTSWNGEPCEARKVRVVVGPSPVSTWWCADLVGTERAAVEVRYGAEVFYLDNETGQGWAKVTIGRGSPEWGHSSLPVERVVSAGPPAGGE